MSENVTERVVLSVPAPITADESAEDRRVFVDAVREQMRDREDEEDL